MPAKRKQFKPVAFIDCMECLPVTKLPDGPEWTEKLIDVPGPIEGADHQQCRLDGALGGPALNGRSRKPSWQRRLEVADTRKSRAPASENPEHAEARVVELQARDIESSPALTSSPLAIAQCTDRKRVRARGR
jgi:hypothetical protein